ncbi:MAG: OsmC family protein [Desulfovibrionaceae bacterium]|nr:OsmC family protein [Desulfovibrionaceae bacterium]
MSHELNVSLTRKGGVIDLDMESGALGTVHIDSEKLSADERAGTAKKLLAASALYCYCAALDKALDARNAKYDRIAGKATLETGTDEKGRGRVTAITLDVTVYMDAEYEFIFDRVEKIMKQGCLVTGSLEAGIKMTYNLDLVCDEDD